MLEGKEALAVVDTQRIHEYVFGPTQLRRIRGASQLLNECTVTRWEELIGQFGGTKIFCGGGNAWARFPTRVKAEQYCQRAVRKLQSETAVATAVWNVEERLAGEKFDDWKERVRQGVEEKKQRGGEAKWPEWNPFARFCDSCGLRTADSARTRRGKTEWLCEGCAKQSDVQKGYWFRRFLEETPSWAGVEEPEDLNTLGEKSRPSGYLAFLYLDVNELGIRFDSLEEEQFTKLSMAVEESTRKAVFRALAEQAHKDKAPFEIFLIGGDDAILALEAQRAADFTMRFFGMFEEEFQAHDAGPAPKVSAGIVYAHSRFPVRMAIDQAEGLLKSCKIRAHLEGISEHMIDYMTITRAVEKPIRELRVDGTLFWRPLGLSEFKRIRELAAILKRMPSTKVSALYDLMFEGQFERALDYCYWLKRLEKERRIELCEWGQPARMTYAPFDGRGRSPFLDAIELMEF